MNAKSMLPCSDISGRSRGGGGGGFRGSVPPSVLEITIIIHFIG